MTNTEYTEIKAATNFADVLSALNVEFDGETPPKVSDADVKHVVAMVRDYDSPSDVLGMFGLNPSDFLFI